MEGAAYLIILFRDVGKNTDIVVSGRRFPNKVMDWWAARFRIATVFFARSRVQPPSSGDAGPASRLTPENEDITISGHFEGSTRMRVCKAVTELVSTSVDQVCAT